jgi:hypothetical protein
MILFTFFRSSVLAIYLSKSRASIDYLFSEHSQTAQTKCNPTIVVSILQLKLISLYLQCVRQAWHMQARPISASADCGGGGGYLLMSFIDQLSSTFISIWHGTIITTVIIFTFAQTLWFFTWIFKVLQSSFRLRLLLIAMDIINPIVLDIKR